MRIAKLKAPNTYFIIFSVIVFVAVLSWIVPGGQYQTATVNGREVVLAESFRYVDPNPQGIAAVLMAPIRGFVNAAVIIGFVLIVGGAFAIFQRTEAVDAGIMAIVKAHRTSRLLRALLIPLIMVLFSLAGATFGMSEQVIPFVLIFIPLALALGYDTITGLGMSYLAAHAGFAAALLNPFTIGVAQGIAGIPLFSGLEYRLVTWVIITAVTIGFVLLHVARIRHAPEKSPTYAKDRARREHLHLQDVETFQGLKGRQKLVLLVFAAGLLLLVYGVLRHRWYIEEITAVFLLTGIAVGIVGRLSVNEITDAFIGGAKELVGTALIIAFARGILIVARDGQIIDTILHAAAGSIRDFGPVISGQAMFIIQTFINFFVPSGSGQAALTMPVMAPLADLVGVSRQTAVLAFQFGDGFSNMIIPTSAVLMGVLSLADLPWEKWARWVLPLQLVLFVIGLLLLVPPHWMNWQ